MGREAGLFFEPAHQTSPPWQSQQLGLNDVFPAWLAKLLRIEVVQYGIHCRETKVFLPPELFVQPDQIPGKNAIWLREQRAYSDVKSILATRHGPVSHALIQKHRAQLNQPRMDDFIHRIWQYQLLFMSDRPAEARVKQRPQCGLPEVTSQIALLGPPQDCGSVKLAHAGCDHRPAQRTAR